MTPRGGAESEAHEGARVRSRTGSSRIQGGRSASRAPRAGVIRLDTARARRRLASRREAVHIAPRGGGAVSRGRSSLGSVAVCASPSRHLSVARTVSREQLRVREPTSGIEPDPPEYEAGARPIELRGQGARGARRPRPPQSCGVRGERAGASG